jgi:hypothetical protein
MAWRSIVWGGVVGAVLAAGCSNGEPGGETGETGDAAIVATSTASVRAIVELPDSQPGDVIALRAAADGSSVVEWIDRRAGTIRSTDVSSGEAAVSDVVTLASIEVGTDGEQSGLLGHAVIGGVRYAAWTDPTTEHLLIGALGDIGPDGAPATNSFSASDSSPTGRSRTAAGRCCNSTRPAGPIRSRSY